jgi:hypothetical protein
MSKQKRNNEYDFGDMIKTKALKGPCGSIKTKTFYYVDDGFVMVADKGIVKCEDGVSYLIESHPVGDSHPTMMGFGEGDLQNLVIFRGEDDATQYLIDEGVSNN